MLPLQRINAEVVVGAFTFCLACLHFHSVISQIKVIASSPSKKKKKWKGKNKVRATFVPIVEMEFYKNKDTDSNSRNLEKNIIYKPFIGTYHRSSLLFFEEEE